MAEQKTSEIGVTIVGYIDLENGGTKVCGNKGAAVRSGKAEKKRLAKKVEELAKRDEETQDVLEAPAAWNRLAGAWNNR